ncbi:MAG: SUMF1/EgtB/PvdO family nonheme iron enzyme [Acidobacteriota bacterium]
MASDQKTLTFELRADSLGINYLRFGPVALRLEPFARFQEISKRLESAARVGLSSGQVGSPGYCARVERELRVQGSSLAEDLLPPSLRKLLYRRRDQVGNVRILSEEPWIPWQMIQLEGGDIGEDSESPPPFLCELFNLTQWPLGQQTPKLLGSPPRLSVRSIAVVAPQTPTLSYPEREVEFLMSLERRGYRVRRIPAKVEAILGAFESGTFDLFHFSGRGQDFQGSTADDSAIRTEGADALRPYHLTGLAKRLGRRAPFVFFNGCYTGRRGFSLTGDGGWTARFLKAGASAFVGAQWLIEDRKAFEFSRVFYREFLNGLPLAESMASARRATRQEGEGTWLAYAAFGHPRLTCRGPDVKRDRGAGEKPIPRSTPESVDGLRRSRADSVETPSRPAPPAESEVVSQGRPRPEGLEQTTPEPLSSEGPSIPKSRPAPRPAPPSKNPDPRPSPRPVPPRPAVAVQTESNSARPVEAEDGSSRSTIVEPDFEVETHPRTGMDFVQVPGGEIELGTGGSGDASPEHTVLLSPFWIARFPVTNAEYARFVANSWVSGPPFLDEPGLGDPNRPVVGVTWKEVSAFCRWAFLDLPTEAQWEAAARGTEGWRYAWGNLPPTPQRACFAPFASGPPSREDYDAVVGPYGTLIQSGGVWEWCRDPWSAKAYRGRHLLQDPVATGAKDLRVVRGGSWASPAGDLLATRRESCLVSTRADCQGFRCVWQGPSAPP